jgi:hypothetical protein
MGHIRLGVLPRTRNWEQVIALLESRAGTAEVAAATLKASKRGLKEAAQDAALVHSLWLLIQLPLCARKPDYQQELANVGLSVSRPPSLTELIGAFSDAVDSHVRRYGKRSDLGEMAQMGAAESLAADVGRRSQSLFGTTAEDVQRSLSRLATEKQFSGLARDFFARVTERYLAYFLSRELSAHIGPDRRFHNATERSEFSDALALHCRQASKIVEAYAGEWFSKKAFETGITKEDVTAFVQVALGKIQAELAQGAVRIE